MQTAVGVFADRERAEEALKLLLQRHIPEDRIIYLTRSESDARTINGQLGRTGGVAGAANLALPGIGSVYSSGFGAASLLGLPAEEGRAASPAAPAAPKEAPALGADSAEEAFFRRVLRDGHSVIVVRSASSQHAAAACEILDKLGLNIKKSPAIRSSVVFRQASGSAVAEFTGKIAFTDGTALLRETVHNFLARGYRRILLDLGRVEFIDSAGLGELVRSHAAVRNSGGQLTLIGPSRAIQQLLQVTRMDQVFDIAPDEYTALNRTKA
jgi:anti-sigma B factor antagonist